MKTVKAPTDPEKNRPYFYIIKDKEIFSAKAEDGTGVCFLYQSDGRLKSSADFVGNVKDQSQIEMLGTVEGFRKLVHSVGISMECENQEELKFVFQMYGKKDLYGGGANLVATVKADGSEHRIYLKDMDWQEDDDVPGQIRIHFPKPEQTAYLNVRFYLNDGFEGPEQIEAKPVDTSSAAYKAMIQKSLMQVGNAARLQKMAGKAKRGEDVTIAYIGGSITQGAGATPINTMCYAYQSFLKLKKLLGDGENIHYIKAGVGGTPSELGMLRFDRDVLEYDTNRPDLVIVEFAVNDEGDETEGVCFESLVRKILALPYEPAVLLLFSVFASDYNLQDRLKPVGERYDLPMVSLKNAVTPQFYDRETRIMTKSQYFYDVFHPTNLGHQVMADCIVYAVEKALEKEKEADTLDLSLAPAIGNTFDKVLLLDKKDNTDLATIEEGGFTLTDTVLQSVERNMDLTVSPQFPYNWMYDGKTCEHKPFRMEIDCKALVLIMKDSGEIDAATAKVYVDGKFVRNLDPYINRWCHCNPLIVIDEKETAHHVVEVVVDEDPVRTAFTILGFGVVKE